MTPPRDFGHLCTALVELDALLRKARVRATLVGGLGVLLHVLARRTKNLPDPTIERAIAAARSTGDVDLAVSAADRKAACAALVENGFQLDRSNPVRFVRGEIIVDVLPWGEKAGADFFLVPALDRGAAEVLASTLDPVLGDAWVLDIAGLVLLKATALRDRPQARDLVDLGSLALLDLYSGRGAGAELGAMTLLPSDRAALSGARRAFETLDRDGPRQYAKSVRASAAFGRDEWDEAEEQICEVVSQAVRALIQIP